MVIFFGNQPGSDLCFNLPTYITVQLSKMMWNVGMVLTRPQRGAFQGSKMPKLSSVWETGRKVSPS